MKNDFNSVPERDKLLHWAKTAADWRNLRAKVDHGGVGTSESNPAELPAGVAQQSAAARCEWAMQQLDQERQNVAFAQSEQARGNSLREELRRLQVEKEAEERKRRGRLMFRLGVAAAVPLTMLLIVGVFLWQRRPPHLAKDAVEQSVSRALAGRGLTLASVTFEVGSLQGSTAPVRATLKARLDQPLFTQIPTPAYLQQNFRLDPAMSQEMAKLISGKDARHILELASLTAGSFDVTRASLLKVASPAGTTFDGTASLRASKTDGTWRVADAFVTLPTMRPEPRPRGAFAAPAFDVDSEEDRSRLRALVDDQPKILARLQRARDTALAEVMAQHKSEEEGLVKFFRAGAVFTGTVAGRAPKEQKPVYLEVTEAAGGSGVHALQALAHNDGGWGDGRAFDGTWKFDTTRERFVVALATRSDQAIAYGGPLLGDVKLIKLELVVDGGRLSGDLDGSTAQFTRVADGEEDRFRRSASPDYFALQDALAPGLYYMGSVAIAAGNTQQVVLRFPQIRNGGAQVDAVLEDPDREAWQYKLTGALTGNHYRDGNWPLRLSVVRTAIPPGIPAKSFVVQFPALVIRMENGKLVGDFRGQPFPFDELPRDEAARRAKTTAEWRRAFDARVRPGSVIAGTGVSPDNTLKNPMLLRVLTVNSDNGAFEGRLEPGRDPTIFRNVTGKVYPEAGTINLDFDVRPNTYRVDPKATEPFFKSGRDALVLAVEGMALTGHDGHNWDFTFRLDPSGRQ